MSTVLASVINNAKRIKQIQEADPRFKTFNAIIYGQPKMGKTSIISTCPGPILVHSFDPGGSKVLADDIDKGRVLVDTRFENDDPYNPRAFDLWCREFDKLESSGFFDVVGTYCLDSMTTWAQCIMQQIIKEASQRQKGRSIKDAPRQQDWMPQMNKIEVYMRKFVSLPCNCILLGHDHQKTDDEGRNVGPRQLMITGKLNKRVPALFDEVYYLTKANAVTSERKLLTQPKNNISAGSRLARSGKVLEMEDPDIRTILKKVGFPHEDKGNWLDIIAESEEVTTE